MGRLIFGLMQSLDGHVGGVQADRNSHAGVRSPIAQAALLV